MLNNINPQSPVPIYQQITNMIQFAVASGTLKSGDRLPSINELSKRVSVTASTVAKAYHDLELQGLIHTQHGTGIFINRNVEAKCRKTCRERITAQLHEVVRQAKTTRMTPTEIRQLAKRCYTTASTPYEQTPDSLLAHARKDLREGPMFDRRRLTER